jgi:hypothetical protein
LHQACMTLDNDFLKLPQLEIKWIRMIQ